ncbi:MAG: hypothetical protein AAFO98_05240 [Pseudomonadota bacterium]
MKTTFKLGLAVLALTAAGLSVNSAARATGHGNTYQFPDTYATVGKWKILAQQGTDTCAAETDNGRVSLRIMFTEYTGDWKIGHPYYQNDDPFVSIGVGQQPGTTDGVQASSTDVNGWAMYTLNDQSFVNDLKRERFFSMTIDRGQQDWSLSGSTRALTLLEECARNLGKRPAAQLSSNTNRPVQNNSRPQRSAGGGGQGLAVYARNVRGWAVYSERRGDQFLGCYAEKRSFGNDFAIGKSDQYGWVLGALFKINGSFDSDLFIDGQQFRGNYFDMNGITVTKLGRQALNALKAGSKATLNIDPGGLPLDLSGSTAAIGKVDECHARRGRQASASGNLAVAPRQARPARPAAPRPVQSANACPAPGTMRSPSTGQPGEVRFLRGANTPAIIFYWLDYNGNEVEMGIWDNQGQFVLQTTAGHLFVAKDRQGRCRGGVIEAIAGPSDITIY